MIEIPHERLINYAIKATFMQMNNQVKVGLATVICLLCQGFIFTYILKVEPFALISIAPLILYIAYIYARNKRVWWYYKPFYWIAAIVILTIVDLAPYAWASIL
jgi:ABC-type iron transport system FetAB permease component